MSKPNRIPAPSASQRIIHQRPNTAQRMIREDPLFERHVAGEPALLQIGSAHSHRRSNRQYLRTSVVRLTCIVKPPVDERIPPRDVPRRHRLAAGRDDYLERRALITDRLAGFGRELAHLPVDRGEWAGTVSAMVTVENLTQLRCQ